MIQYLSYPILKSMPIYGGCADLKVIPINSIDKGDSCNTFSFNVSNHWGTHVDCPAHFFNNGKKVEEYPAEFWFFNNPQVIKVDAVPGQIITCNSFSDNINSKSDLILFESRWWKLRKDEIYYKNNPGLHPEVAFLLRKKFPSVRAIGIDWISISAFQNRKIGREAHKAFLNPNTKGHPLLIIEDMNLSINLNKLTEVWAVPFLIEGIDSSPCTIMGIFED